MRAENFRHGLDQQTIQPINKSQMILPYEPGYPSSNNGNIVIGANFAGDARA
jgi:hypothetical protein